ncbi:hypothetical protein Tco_0264482 [Tanacetum coccineum]
MLVRPSNKDYCKKMKNMLGYIIPVELFRRVKRTASIEAGNIGLKFFRLCYLNVLVMILRFIIGEQRIVALWVEWRRLGGGDYGGSDYRVSRNKVWWRMIGCCGVAAEWSKKREGSASLKRKESSQLLVDSNRISQDSDKIQSISFAQGTIPNIPIGGSINFEGFLSSILLVVVIIVTIVIVVVILVVVIFVIVEVVIVVVIFGVVIVVVDGHLLRENTDSIRVPVRLLGLLALVMAAVCASMAVVRSAISCRMASKVMADGDNDTNDGDVVDGEIVGNNNKIHLNWTFSYFKYLRWVEEEDEEQIRFLGGNSSSGIEKYRGSNSSDGGTNTGDGVKIAGEAIGSGDEIGAEVEYLEPGFELQGAKMDHMGAKDCCIMGLRKKRCGANWNEGGLSKEGYGARWKLMKVVLGVVVAAAEVGQQGHHVASFETKKWS